MPTGTLEFTLISAAISPGFDTEPTDTYAILRCIKEQRSTKTARDQGRLPAWNETFTFNLQEQDMSNDILVQVFGVKTEVDELLGLARIPILTMIGKEEAMLCALISPSRGETGKLKAAWRWTPDSQRSLKATNFEGKVSGVQEFTERESYTSFDPNVPYRSLKATNFEGEVSGVQEYTRSESYTSSSFDPNVPYVGDLGPVPYLPYSKLDAVSNAFTKLTVDKGPSGRSTPSAPPYLEDSIRATEDVKAQGGEYYPYSTSAGFGEYPTEHIPISEPSVFSGYPDIRASRERKEEFGAYSSPVYSRGPSEHTYPPPPADAIAAFPPNKDTYPPYSGYQSSTLEFAHDKGTTYPPYSDYHNSSPLDKQGEELAYTERGIGGDAKEKGKGYGSHTPYGQPPLAGYPPSSYPPPPSGHLPSSYPPPYGHPPEAAHGYPPGPQGYPPAPYAYPPAPHAYPPAPHGYPLAPQGYPPAPHGYPPAVDHHSVPAYPPYGYPPSAHGSHQAPYPIDHGHGSGYAAAGAYVGHSSSSSKHSKKHEEPKHSSSHQHGYAQPHYAVHEHGHGHGHGHGHHNKHKKQKSFKKFKF